ncbi:MAG: 3'(2'),5'-bisphosphate nucleotidase CysQ [Nitrospirota bacterium]|nr:3'(2'),5'-bisphosphate nucleotidase CysQ [Nitrospirota bacterium]
MHHFTELNYEAICNTLISVLLASKNAGNAILEVYNTPNFIVEHKDDRSPLTLADKESHRIIADRLSVHPLNLFPVLSEEGRDIPFEERKSWDLFWLVDPLDGTKEFINRNGEFTVNIALIDKDRPVLGVVYVPVKDIFYYCAVGIGAYKLSMGRAAMDEQAEGGGSRYFEGLINASERLDIKEKFYGGEGDASGISVIGSRSHMSKETEEYINGLKDRYGGVEFIAAGSSLKFCLVAEGSADIYPRFGPTMEWDTAAGQAVVEQAGGKVLNMESSEPLKYNKENLLNPYFVAGKTDFIL